MAEYVYYLSRAREAIMGFVYGIVNDIWRWFALLNREEWAVVLVIVAVCGFLCMRGFGSRSRY